MVNLKTDNINVISAETSTKLDVDGMSKTYEVFKIKLNLLYYNDKNDRIATWISQYIAEKGPLNLNNPNYNNIIAEFITQSNSQAMQKTEKNIYAVKQRVPGVVLRDGRIIDGNRRFTCLRNLAKKDDSFNYFEAVILDRNYDVDEKVIKKLELRLQHGVDKQIDYNPIDRLVGIYNDIILKGTFTEEEYAECTGEKVGVVTKNVELAKLLVDFLKFINAPLQFHLARSMDLDGPLHEIQNALCKMPDDDRKESIKRAMFANLAAHPSGDMTRYIRKIKNISNDEEISGEFLDKQDELVTDMIEAISSINEPITQKVISEKIQGNKKLKESLKSSVDRYYDKYSAKENKNEPLKLIARAQEIMDNLDKEIIKMADREKIVEVKASLDSIITKATELKEEL